MVRLIRRWRRLAARVELLSLADRFWLTLAVATGLLVHLVYLRAHAYPAYGAGLYLAIAETIAAHGYALPATVDGYTAGGVPLAYPPFAFYLAAAARDVTGLGAFAYSRLVPGLLVTAALVPYYYVARELLAAPRRAGVATLLFAGTPAVLQWHLSAGGIVRTVGLLVALVACYAGVRLFRDGGRRWLVAATALFGLAVLTHPVYAAFVAASYLVFFAGLSRTPRGLARGAVVAAGGLALAAPWWLQVAATHGPGVFTAAAGTHGGLGGGPARLLTEFVYPVDFDAGAPAFLAAYAGAGYALWRRRVLLPAWLVAAGFVVGKPRFLFVAGSMLTAVLLFEVGVPFVRRHTSRRIRPRAADLAAVALVVLAAVGTGTAFAAGAVDTHDGHRSQPAFVDWADHEAMTWVGTQTPPSTRFVVLGDAAEWFPLAADRTILVGPWGVEWTTPDRYQRQLDRYTALSDCDRASCITAHLRALDVAPEYVYVPKATYTVRGVPHRQSAVMGRSLARSDRYRVVYENAGVLVARVTPVRSRCHPDASAGACRSTRTSSGRPPTKIPVVV